MPEQQWPTPTYRPPVDGGPAAPVSTQTTVDADDPHAQASFWAAALGYLIQDPHDLVVAVLAAGYANRDRPLFQLVQDRDRDKNSWHLDLNVGRGNIDAEVTRLTALGAVGLHGGPRTRPHPQLR